MSQLSQREAVFKAIEDLGDQSKGDVLRVRAERYYGGDITHTAVYTARRQWREENGVVRDCRTYEGQPRRNMLNDNLIELPLLKKLSAFVKKHGKATADLLALLNDSHSKEQLLHGFEELQNLQFAA